MASTAVSHQVSDCGPWVFRNRRKSLPNCYCRYHCNDFSLCKAFISLNVPTQAQPHRRPSVSLDIIISIWYSHVSYCLSNYLSPRTPSLNQSCPCESEDLLATTIQIYNQPIIIIMLQLTLLSLHLHLMIPPRLSSL